MSNTITSANILDDEWLLANPVRDARKDAEEFIEHLKAKRERIAAKVAKFGADALQPESAMARLLNDGTVARTTWGEVLESIDARISAEIAAL